MNEQIMRMKDALNDAENYIINARDIFEEYFEELVDEIEKRDIEIEELKKEIESYSRGQGEHI